MSARTNGSMELVEHPASFNKHNVLCGMHCLSFPTCSPFSSKEILEKINYLPIMKLILLSLASLILVRNVACLLSPEEIFDSFSWRAKDSPRRTIDHRRELNPIIGLCCSRTKTHLLKMLTSSSSELAQDVVFEDPKCTVRAQEKETRGADYGLCLMWSYFFPVCGEEARRKEPYLPTLVEAIDTEAKKLEFLSTLMLAALNMEVDWTGFDDIAKKAIPKITVAKEAAPKATARKVAPKARRIVRNPTGFPRPKRIPRKTEGEERERRPLSETTTEGISPEASKELSMEAFLATIGLYTRKEQRVPPEAAAEGTSPGTIGTKMQKSYRSMVAEIRAFFSGPEESYYDENGTIDIGRFLESKAFIVQVSLALILKSKEQLMAFYDAVYEMMSSDKNRRFLDVYFRAMSDDDDDHTPYERHVRNYCLCPLGKGEIKLPPSYFEQLTKECFAHASHDSINFFDGDGKMAILSLICNLIYSTDINEYTIIHLPDAADEFKRFFSVHRKPFKASDEEIRRGWEKVLSVLIMDESIDKDMEAIQRRGGITEADIVPAMSNILRVLRKLCGILLYFDLQLSGAESESEVKASSTLETFERAMNEMRPLPDVIKVTMGEMVIERFEIAPGKFRYEANGSRILSIPLGEEAVVEVKFGCTREGKSLSVIHSTCLISPLPSTSGVTNLTDFLLERCSRVMSGYNGASDEAFASIVVEPENMYFVSFSSITRYMWKFLDAIFPFSDEALGLKAVGAPSGTSPEAAEALPGAFPKAAKIARIRRTFRSFLPDELQLLFNDQRVSTMPRLESLMGEVFEFRPGEARGERRLVKKVISETSRLRAIIHEIRQFEGTNLLCRIMEGRLISFENIIGPSMKAAILRLLIRHKREERIKAVITGLVGRGERELGKSFLKQFVSHAEMPEKRAILSNLIHNNSEGMRANILADLKEAVKKERVEEIFIRLLEHDQGPILDEALAYFVKYNKKEMIALASKRIIKKIPDPEPANIERVSDLERAGVKVLDPETVDVKTISDLERAGVRVLDPESANVKMVLHPESVGVGVEGFETAIKENNWYYLVYFLEKLEDVREAKKLIRKENRQVPNQQNLEYLFAETMEYPTSTLEDVERLYDWLFLYYDYTNAKFLMYLISRTQERFKSVEKACRCILESRIYEEDFNFVENFVGFVNEKRMELDDKFLSELETYYGSRPEEEEEAYKELAESIMELLERNRGLKEKRMERKRKAAKPSSSGKRGKRSK
jgi:hypothetical protein